MSPRRPPRAWIGEPVPVDPGELAGPRGLVREVLEGMEEPAETPDGDDAFYWALLSEARKARILAVVEARLSSVTVVLDRLVDPHNTAAILRTSEALGIGKLHVVPHQAGDEVAHRRVTQDAEKWVEVEVHDDGAACVHALRGLGYRVYAGHLETSALPYTRLPADAPVALVFGNEHEGPGAATLEACDGTFRIPMAGFTQSFNVSVAAGIALADLTRRRRESLGKAGDLSSEARVALRKRFTLLAAKLARRLKRP